MSRFLLRGWGNNVAETARTARRYPENPHESKENSKAYRLLSNVVMKGIWRFEDLVAWQLAVQLQTIVDRYSERPQIKSDVKFFAQMTDAGASGPRNIAEGFGRFHHPEFARFARIAQASEQEVLNHLYRARNKNYITPAEFEDGAHAARKALKAINGLIKYLDSTPNFGK